MDAGSLTSSNKYQSKCPDQRRTVRENVRKSYHLLEFGWVLFLQFEFLCPVLELISEDRFCFDLRTKSGFNFPPNLTSESGFWF